MRMNQAMRSVVGLCSWLPPATTSHEQCHNRLGVDAPLVISALRASAMSVLKSVCELVAAVFLPLLTPTLESRWRDHPHHRRSARYCASLWLVSLGVAPRTIRLPNQFQID